MITLLISLNLAGPESSDPLGRVSRVAEGSIAFRDNREINIIGPTAGPEIRALAASQAVMLALREYRPMTLRTSALYSPIPTGTI